MSYRPIASLPHDEVIETVYAYLYRILPIKYRLDLAIYILQKETATKPKIITNEQYY